ncbi:MAG: phage tail tape measure protein [Paracoccus sp. (in: a-proteobacteria)]
MNASAADVTDIIGRQGGFAKVAGMSTTEIAALATAFRTAAPSSEIAATAMKNFTATLVAGEAMSDRQAKIMKRLGFDATELAQRMRVDAKGSIIDVMEALKKLPEHEQAANLRQLFGDEAVGAVTPLLENLDNLRRAFDLVGDPASYAGAMQAEYEGVAGTTSAKLVVFRNHLTRLSVALIPLLSAITDVTEALQPMLQRMSDWMQANPETVKWIGMAVAGLFAVKVGVLGALMAVQSLVGAWWLFNGVLALGIRGYAVAVRGIAGLLRVFVALSTALPLVARGIALIGRAMLANPIGLAVAAIAGAVYLIYRNWATVGPWFGRLWGNVREIFGGFGRFLRGIFTGDLSGAVAGLQQVWDSLKGYYKTLWDGIVGIFKWAWENGIKPITDALGVTDSIVAGWNIAKDALGAALDWISSKCSEAWAIISPVINGLKWVQDNGAAAMNLVTGSRKGPISSGYNGVASNNGSPILPPAAVPGVTVPAVPARAQGGSFFPGALLVGERGPELRYESRGGFIAHHNALRGLVDLSQRARSLAGLVMGGGPAPEFGGASMPVPVAAPAGQARQISHQPHYNIVINGSGLDAGQLRAAVRAELQAAGRRAAADLRGLLHD